MADTFDDRFGFKLRTPTGDPSVDAILPLYVPTPPSDYKEGDVIPGGTPPVLNTDPNLIAPIPADNPLDARAQDEPLPIADEVGLPDLPTGDPLSGQNQAYESHGGVDYSGRPSSLAEAYARGSVDVNSLTPEQLARVEAEIAANPTLGALRSSRRG